MSRLRSARGASPRTTAAAAGRAPAGGRRVLVPAPQSDIYVTMLAISLGAIVIGCLLLLLVLNRYEFSLQAASLNLPELLGPASWAATTPVEKIVTVHL